VGDSEIGGWVIALPWRQTTASD